VDFTENLRSWLAGETFQGRTMLAFGVVAIGALVLVLRSQEPLLRGMLVPLCLLLALLLGYGGLVAFGRSARVEKVVSAYAEKPEETIAAEISKHEKDLNFCELLKKIYPVLIILAAVMVLLAPTPYWKGLGVGLVLLFLATYLVDTGFALRSSRILEALR